jgi:hypothetical protein
VPPPFDFENWNLNGHDINDKSKNFITPDAWYNCGAYQFKKRDEEQRAKGTNADCIVKRK